MVSKEPSDFLRCQEQYASKAADIIFNQRHCLEIHKLHCAQGWKRLLLSFSTGTASELEYDVSINQQRLTGHQLAKWNKNEKFKQQEIGVEVDKTISLASFSIKKMIFKMSDLGVAQW